ncbi:hypothetical protein BC936DRAFT_138406 [Jimgerdemannia flammicorona]|uniref:Uncharacterized protein n=1 Tax=Jimgerdemannia flammicorona TaxID=994334 RepID=A0A433DID5_9FUNG|nr:hypothetical protein BC936DRAFT_138406 [Jimgerdemannia flammicorona]
MAIGMPHALNLSLPLPSAQLANVSPCLQANLSSQRGNHQPLGQSSSTSRRTFFMGPCTVASGGGLCAPTREMEIGWTARGRCRNGLCRFYRSPPQPHRRPNFQPRHSARVVSLLWYPSPVDCRGVHYGAKVHCPDRSQGTSWVHKNSWSLFDHVFMGHTMKETGPHRGN